MLDIRDYPKVIEKANDILSKNGSVFFRIESRDGKRRIVCIEDIRKLHAVEMVK